MSESRAGVLAPMAQFRATFPLVLLLTLWVVLLASSIQIRRTTQPLVELQDATRRVTRREFGTDVRVRSGDEFEDLAVSFNSMAHGLERLLAELDALNWGTLTALARTIDAKSPWTAGHSERVTALAAAVAKELGLAATETETLHRGALLHDIGKIGVPPEILDKDDRLTDVELAVMQSHVEVGARILSPIAAYAPVIPIVLHHHERLDGSGYPHGLRGPDIPLLARVLAVADVYDALTSDRPYRAGWTPERALDYIRNLSGIQFDADVVAALTATITRAAPTHTTISSV